MAHTGAVEPTADDIRLQLDRLLASEGFANADRMSGFLRFVVERSLAGESDRVKEYTIGVEVFDRGEGYDPRVDSIVRVEARRLRAKLDEYYSREGQSDPVVIRMRPGSYVPLIELRPPASSSSTDGPKPTTRQARQWWPVGLGLGLAAVALGLVAARSGLWATSPVPPLSIAVLPFAEYSPDEADRLLAARLTDGVTSALAATGRLGVVSHTSALQFGDGPRTSVRDIGRALGADVIMEARVIRSGDDVEVEVRLVDASTDRKIWVQRFTGSAGDTRDLERRIVIAAVPAALDVGVRD